MTLLGEEFSFSLKKYCTFLNGGGFFDLYLAEGGGGGEMRQKCSF